MNKWGSDFAIKWLTIGTNDHSCEANLYFLATYAFFESALYLSDNSRHFLGNFILVPQLTFAGRQKMRPIAQPRPAPPLLATHSQLYCFDSRVPGRRLGYGYE